MRIWYWLFVLGHLLHVKEVAFWNTDSQLSESSNKTSEESKKLGQKTGVKSDVIHSQTPPPPSVIFRHILKTPRPPPPMQMTSFVNGP
jgi:hypothetical protein